MWHIIGSMMKKRYSKAKKQKARKLRKNDGLSYKEISDKLGIAKSTAKEWCAGIQLNSRQRKRLYTKQIKILIQGPNSSHERRKKEIDKIIRSARKEILFPLSANSYKLLGAMLYWAEGDKTNQFAISNSDPVMIKFFIQWLQKVLKISPERIKAHLNIYPQQNEGKIKKFWSEITRIPLTNFGKSFVKPKNKNYKKNILYYGTIKIRVKRGTDLRHRVFGWTKAVLEDTESEINEIERRWHKLKIDYPRP
jgi:transcriptional regulator with XRE-family HTH domain